MKSLFEMALAAEGAAGPFADLARSTYKQESGSGKNPKTSNAGAVGGMQILPATFNSVADKGWDINDPLQNARAGIRYLNQMYKQAGGDPALAAAGYYGGPGGLEKARRGVAVSDPRNPGAPNTLEYGQQVAGRVGKPAPNVAAVVPVQAPPAVTPLPVEQVAVAPPVTDAPMVPSTPVPEWTEFQNQTQKPIEMADLSFGMPALQPLPRFNMPIPQAQKVSFAGFRPWKARV